MLYLVSLPSHGGDTQYVNMRAAYDDLLAATKERIDGLKAVHVYLSNTGPRVAPAERRQRLPGAAAGRASARPHPSRNGRKALYLNPVRIESILGIEDDEALDLVAGLMAHAVQPKYEYRQLNGITATS